MNTFVGRLATFDGPVQLSKRRASSAKKKTTTTVSWPHQSPSPEQLARAGFYYKPSAVHHDSVTCFLCDKALNGWDPEDDPAVEHLAHVPDCGWAINVCIELRSQEMDRAEEDPRSQKMTEARRATFRDDWPHEGKKGWKCKVQKMVDAGWSYEPLPEGDDCVKCFYCGVSLDGWEPKDDPWEEHRRRSPECHFFTLIKDASKADQPAKKKNTRAARSSKASRLSTQSIVSVMSEAPSFVSLNGDAAEEGDTILTSASSRTRNGKSRAKTTTTKRASRAAKPHKKTTRKPSAVFVDELENDDAVDATEVTYDEPIEPSFVTNLPEARSAGRTATRRKATQNTESSVLAATTDALSPPGRVPRQRANKKQSKVGDVTHIPMDADVTLPEALPRAKPPRGKKATTIEVGVLDSSVVFLDEAPAPAPKSRPTRAKKGMSDGQGKVEGSMVVLDNMPAPDLQPRALRGKKRLSDGVNKIDSSMIVLDSLPAPELPLRATRGKKRTSDGSEKADVSTTMLSVLEQPTVKPITKQKVIKASKRRDSDLREASVLDQYAESQSQQTGTESIQSPQQKTRPSRKAAPRKDEERPVEAPQAAARTASLEQIVPAPTATRALQAVETTQAHAAPMAAAEESRGPSSSPQSSDAENRPPSSRPSIAAVAAAPTKSLESTTQVSALPITPTASPSTRNDGAHGLQSLFPWKKIDLETAFLPSPAAEGLGAGATATVEETLQRLGSEEKAMSVEEWIIWNARRAEDRLKGECERLINKFESEGVRALRAVEGIECV